jgi:type II secretory pathway component PulF
VSTDKPDPEPEVVGDTFRAPRVLDPVPQRRGGFRLVHWMLLIGVLAVLLWLCLMIGSVIYGVFGAIFLVGLCVVGIVTLIASRNRMQQESLLWALAIAAERGVPLPPAALAFIDQFGGGYRWRVQMLAGLLESGEDLGAAIDKVPGLLSREAVVLIKAGSTSGRLPEALRQAAVSRLRRQSAWGNVAASAVYLGCVFFGMIVIVGFVLYYIIPKFEAIFSDFGVALPDMTRLVIQASHFVIEYFFVWFFLLLLVVGVLVGFFNPFGYDVPMLDRLFRRRHSALVMRALALSVTAGKPIASGIARLRNDYPSTFIRSRLRQVNEEVSGGAEWIASLYRNGLIRHSEAVVLATSQRVGNLEWALNEMASSTERRLGYQIQFWLQLLFPVFVLALGAFVFFLTVSFFLPLITLISRLSG